MQIIQERNPWEPFAQGFSQGLQNLAQGVAKGQERKSLEKALVATKKYTPEEAHLIAIAPEKLSKEFMRSGTATQNASDYSSIISGTEQQNIPQGNIQGQQTAQQSPIAAAMQGMGQQQPQAPADFGTQLSLLAQQQRKELLNRMMGAEQPNVYSQAQTPTSMQLLQGMAQPSQAIQPFMNQAAQNMYPEIPSQTMAPMPQPAQAQPMPIQEQPTQASQQVQEQAPQQVASPAQRIEEEANRYRKAAMLATSRGDKLNADQFNENANSLEKKARNIEKNQAGIDKEIAKKAEPIFEKATAAQNSMRLTNDQRKLLFKGGLSKQSVAALANFFDEKYGEGTGDLLRSAPTQVYKKIGAKRFGDVTSALGGAVRSVGEVTLFMRQFPRETNDERAMEANFNYTDVEDYINKVRGDAAEEIYKENGKAWPKDFDIAMREKMRQKDAEIASNIKEIIEPLPDAKEYARTNPGEYLNDTRTGLKLKPVNGKWRSF